ncbi:MAG: glucose-1-phosphate adenylyltransferase subunit GlgD [Clostridia bacterium]|nr:glucose-1-phosphate adenylyltransferase subunit GlgD [Clostridia bacterium]
MRADTMGIVFSNISDSLIPSVASLRCMGSVPFAGKYRLIDFVLSNLQSCGVTKVGIITKRNYHSLMDHLGSGKPWDLARKRGGIFVFPPFATSGSGVYSGRVDALSGVSGLLRQSREEYVILSDSSFVVNCDLEAMMERHIETGADITIAYTNGATPNASHGGGAMTFSKLAADGRIQEIKMLPPGEQAKFSVNIAVIRRELLLSLLKDAVSRNLISVARDLLQKSTDSLRLYAYELPDPVYCVDSMRSYFETQMKLLDPEVRRQLFDGHHRINTAVTDTAPARYGEQAKVVNSLVSDGCIINGEISGCILGRNVIIERGAQLKNCVIMANTKVAKNVQLSYVMTDKNVTVSEGITLTGSQSYPIYLEKDALV